MTGDLETLIRERQDQLRGRPRSKKDDIADWWSNFDFVDCVTEIMGWLAAVIVIPVFIFMIVALFMLATTSNPW